MNGIESLLERIANASDVEEDRSESRFFQIQSDMEKGNYDEASQLIRDLFNEGYFDIRLIAYYLYNHVIQFGREGLVQSYKTLHLLLESHTSKLFPLSGRRKQSASGLKWFFTTLARSLKRATTKVKAGQHSPLWSLFADDLTQESLDSMRETLQSTSAFFQDYFKETEDFGEVFGYLRSWIDELEVFIPQEAVEELTPVGKVPEQVAEQQDKVIAEPMIAEPMPQLAKAQATGKESYPWRQLKKKLKLFERLTKDKTPDAEVKRAIAIKDISHLIENFNPAEYFPDEFTSFYTLLAKCKEPPAIEPDSPNAFGWNTLASLYKIDLEAFERWKKE